MFCDIFGPGFVGLRGSIRETYFPQPNNQDMLKSSLMSCVSKQPAWWREGLFFRSFSTFRMIAGLKLVAFGYLK